MAKLVDATDLKSVIRKGVRVRVPLSVLSDGVQGSGRLPWSSVLGVVCRSFDGTAVCLEPGSFCLA